MRTSVLPAVPERQQDRMDEEEKGPQVRGCSGDGEVAKRIVAAGELLSRLTEDPTAHRACPTRRAYRPRYREPAVAGKASLLGRAFRAGFLGSGE
jgi:hypothetical protein